MSNEPADKRETFEERLKKSGLDLNMPVSFETGLGTLKGLQQACKNVGIDLDCRTCAAQFLTGLVLPSDVHTCDATNHDGRHTTARERYLFDVIGMRNRTMTYLKDEREEAEAARAQLWRKYVDLREILSDYGKHKSWCPKEMYDGTQLNHDPKCSCGYDQARDRHKPKEEGPAPIPLRVAKWIEEHGKDLSPEAIAQAVLEGRWR